MTTGRAKLRKRAGMSPTQPSRASGVSVSRLSRYEGGECLLPDRELATIGVVLKESPDDTPAFASDEQLDRIP
jgi:hypothetical protein